MRLSQLRSYNLKVVALLIATNFLSAVSANNTIKVEITNFEFEPAIIEVEPGDSIVFVNRDIVPHTATANDGSWDTGNIASNESKTIIIHQDMDPDFYCFYHQAMKGKFTSSD